MGEKKNNLKTHGTLTTRRRRLGRPCQPGGRRAKPTRNAYLHTADSQTRTLTRTPHAIHTQTHKRMREGGRWKKVCSIGYIDTIFIPLSSNVVDPNGENFSRPGVAISRFVGVFAIGFSCCYNERMKHGALVQTSGMMRKKSLFEKNAFANDNSRSISVKSRSGFPTGREIKQNKQNQRA